MRTDGVVLELKLHPRREERGPFQETRHRRIHAIDEQAAQALCDARIFLGEFTRLLIQKRELHVVQVEEFAMHLDL
jgi:hypothetical protein